MNTEDKEICTAIASLAAGLMVTVMSLKGNVDPETAPGLIANIRDEFMRPFTDADREIDADADEADVVAMPTPEVIQASITPDHLTSFIDGKPYKTLKRHLTLNGFDPLTYRQRYGLPADYPMTSPNYSAARSELAKRSRLGVKAAA